MGERIEARNFGLARSYQRTPAMATGLFDHILRNDESYPEKWKYMRENAVRAGLVQRAHDWPYQAECVFIDRT